MAELTITIDGVEVVVPDTVNVVDAARLANIQIPVFCYHPRLPAVGMCRMCMVAVGTPRIDRDTRQPVLDEHGKPVIQMNPKLQPACTTRVSPGMAVVTNSEEVKFAQKGVLEFLLTSHPLDCPVCDKGGECPLQNLTMEWGPGNSRFDYSDKIHFEKPVRLGDLINLDRERCILCSRCVRFQDDLADDPVLGFDSRGRSWHIISKSDPPFDSKFSGNTTDICPVGALTTSDFRFKARAWELSPTPSLCNHCSVGCNITLDMRHNEIKRVMPRENAAVNDIWICDKGRFGHRFIESEARLTTPLIRRNGTLEPASWQAALNVIAERFRSIHGAAGGSALGGLAGEHLANEDLFLFQRLFRELLDSNNLDTRHGAPGEPQPDDIGYTYGVGKGTNLMTLGSGTAVLVIGADPEEEAPLYMLRLRQIARQGGTLIVANPRPTKLDRSAAHTLHYRPGDERQILLALLRLLWAEVGTKQAPPRTAGTAELKAVLDQVSLADIAKTSGVAAETLKAVAHSLQHASNVVIVYGADLLRIGRSVTALLADLLLLLGKVGIANSGLIPLLPRGNSRGALDMGVRPDKAAGYIPLKQPGLSAREMWQAALDGKLRGMYVMGSDPVASYPPARAALEALEFLVVQDSTLTATAELADVVLPAATVAEYDATYTNAERRVQRARLARKVYDESKPAWEIVQAVAQALQAELVPVDGETSTATTAIVGNGKGVKGKVTIRSGATPSTALVSSEAGWDYLNVAEVALDIADMVPGYAGITHSALAKTATASNWGRQKNEAYYYDGTSYENAEGVGLQVPAGAEQPKASLDLTPPEVMLVPTSSEYPFALQVQVLAYSNDPFLRDSLLQNHIPAGYIALNVDDAAQLGISRGDVVQVTSAAGSVQGTARPLADLPAGSVLIPAGLPDLTVATIQTGALTRVAVSKVA